MAFAKPFSIVTLKNIYQKKAHLIFPNPCLSNSLPIANTNMFENKFPLA